MRRIHRVAPVAVLTCAMFMVLAAPAGAQGGAAKPDLMVSSSAEPPDFVPLDGDFLASFTVDNQGRGRARRTSLARAYLSVGRVLSADDRRRRVGDRRVRALSPGRSTTRRMVVEIPAQFQTGEYFLIVCADVRNVIDETNDRANCHVSGQRLRVAAEDVRGAPGPPGPAGPAGPPGEGGGNPTFNIPRKILPLGTATLLGFYSSVGDNEGSTSQFDLLEVGGVRIRALCRATTNGDNGLPSDTPGNDDQFNDEDGDEAKILLYYDRPQGDFSFDGEHGRRWNVPAGFGRRTDQTDSGETAPETDGGEGQHMFLTMSQDPETHLDGGDSNFDFHPEFGAAYRSTSGIVSTSEGTDFQLSMFVGIGVLGASHTECVFGGTASVINR